MKRKLRKIISKIMISALIINIITPIDTKIVKATDTGIVIDNSDSRYEESGSGWLTSTNTAAFPTVEGGNHRYNKWKGQYARWNISNVPEGKYRVFFNKLVHSSNDSVAPLSVISNGKEDVKIIDLASGDHGYTLIGTYDFSQDGNQYVQLDCATEGKQVRADSIKLVPISFTANLKGEDITSSSVKLTWDKSDWAEGYYLYRALEDNEFVKVAEVSKEDNYYIDSNLKESTKYNYYISAYDNLGEVSSSLDEIITIETEAANAYILLEEDFEIENDYFKVNARVYSKTDVAEEVVYVSAKANGEELKLTTDKIVLGDAIGESAEGLYYDLELKIDKSEACGNVEYEVSALIGDQSDIKQYYILNKPESPSGLVSGITTEKSIEILWNKSDTATNYKLFKKSDTNTEFVEIYDGENSSYIDEDVNSKSKYYYKVVAINEAGESEEAAVIEAISRKSLSLNCDISVSNYYDKTPSENAVDGDIDTMWRIPYGDNKDNLWATISFPEKVTFDSIVIKTYLAEMMKNYKVQYSNDGYNWTDIHSQSNSPEMYKVVKYDESTKQESTFSTEVFKLDSKVTARYIRFYAEKGKFVWPGLYSFEVYGDESDINPENSYDYELPKNITVTNKELNFEPLKKYYAVQVTEDSKLEVTKSLEVQKVFIDGVETTEKIINVEDLNNGNMITEVKVLSKDETREISYVIEFSNNILDDESFKLAFSDEFDGDTLNEDTWKYRISTLPKTDHVRVNAKENVTVSDGKLHIALKEEEKINNLPTFSGGGVYTKQGFGYGYYEVSAKLTDEKGWHSSFWSFGYDTMPESLEIDCFEVDSEKPYEVKTAGHKYSNGLIPGKSLISKKYEEINTADGYHTYGYEWTPSKIKFYVDGVMTRETDFDGPLLPANIWLTALPYTMPITASEGSEITFDYFRYYNKDYNEIIIPDNAVIIDNEDEGYSESGTWEVAQNALSYDVNEIFNSDNGVKYAGEEFDGFELRGVNRKKTKQSNTIGSIANWKYDISEAGIYRVAVWNPSSYDNTTEAAKFTVKDNNGEKNIYINQNTEGQKWVELGEFEFVEGNIADVQLSVINSNNTRADAVMFVKVADIPVKVESVQLDADKVTLEVGQEKQLNATVLPNNSTNKGVVWSSRNEDIAKVDDNGNVTAVSHGKAIITVTTDDGNFTATCEVTANSKWIEINRSPEINANDIDVFVGDNFDAKSNVTAEDYEDGDLTNNIRIKENTVDTSKAGEYEVVYSVTDSKGATTIKKIKVIVQIKEIDNNVKVESVQLDVDKVTLEVGQEKQLNATVLPNNSINKDVVWSSSNEDIAKVDDNGNVTAVSHGKAIITVTTKDGNFTAICEVTVNSKWIEINRAPEINANDINIFVGDIFDAIKGITADDYEDGNLTSSIKIKENTVDTSKAGEYEVVYSVTDSKEATTIKKIKVIVQIKEIEKPNNDGNGDKPDIEVDPEKPNTDGETADKLPNTGGNSATFYMLIAILIIYAGVGRVVNKKIEK